MSSFFLWNVCLCSKPILLIFLRVFAILIFYIFVLLSRETGPFPIIPNPNYERRDEEGELEGVEEEVVNEGVVALWGR